MNKAISSILALTAAFAANACSDGGGPVGNCVDETCMNICEDRECGPSAYNSDYSCGNCDNGWFCSNGTCVMDTSDIVILNDTLEDAGLRDTYADTVAGDTGADAVTDDKGMSGDVVVDATQDVVNDAGGDVGCVQNCEGIECGSDPVCGEPCGECSGRDECVEGRCKCTPFEGRVCGDDGCGKNLGDCPSDGQVCDKGQCVTAVPTDMVLVPGGKFSMGCSTTATTIACDADEKPAHDVTITEFLIDKTEVTRGAFQKCVDAGECDKPACSDSVSTIAEENMPVACVTWKDAAAYCAWMGRRLPTEAEWEYAARYNDGRVYPWGNNDASCTYAQMFNGTKSGCGSGTAAAVCSKPEGKSFLALCDMAGNVWEWVNDYYSSTYYKTAVATDPQGPTTGVHQVRGGGWYYDLLTSELKDVRSTNRFPVAVDTGLTDYIGFRCAM